MNTMRKRGKSKHEKAISGGIGSEEALCKSDEMFRILAEMSSAVIFVYQDENIIYANKAAERITGYSKDELLKKKFWEYAHPDFHGLLRERGLARLRGEQVESHYEVKFVTKSGETRWADLAAGRIELNGKPAGIATYIDITERKRSEETLQQVNRVVESCPVIIFNWKAPEGSPVILIAGNVEQFGYTREELQSGATPYVSVIYPEDRERVIAEVLEYSASGTDQFRQEFRIITRDGQVRWVDDRTVVERDAAGKIDHYHGIIIDITGRKQAEEALRDSEERLRLCTATARLGTFDWDLVNDRHIWSPETYEIYGVQRETPLTIDMIMKQIHPDDRLDQMVAAEFDPATSHGGFTWEYRIFRTSDGAMRWIYQNVSIFFAGTGPERRAVRVLGVVQDITERKKAEEILHESEERLRLCIATAGLGSYDSDLVNDRHIWSPETYDIYGVPQDTPLTLEYIHGLVVPEDLQDELFASEMDPATSHGGYCMEYRIRRPSDGAIRWVNTKTRVFFSGEGVERKAVRILGIVQDITERKQAEEALRESYALLDTITSNTPDQVYVKDREGRFIFANPAVFDSFKEPPEAVLGKHPSEFYHDAATLATIMENDRKIMESGGTKVLEETALTPHGPRTYLSTKTPRRNDKGEVVGLIGISRDITERKLIEKALKERETFLSNLFASIQDGISVLDKDLNILSVNPVMEKWYGKGIAGKKCYEAYHGRNSPCEKCPSIRAMREKATQTEVVQDIRTWVEIFAYPYLNDSGDVTGVIEQVRDITERKQAELALRESEERLRLCNAAARLGTLDWDLIHDRHVWSPEIFEIFGLPPDTVLTLGLITDMVYPGDRLDDAFAAGMSPSGPGEFAMEYRIIRASDRAVRWVRQTMRVIFEGEGAARHAVRVLGIVQDITERKKAEEALGIAKAQAELYLDLMGHDINNINQVALGYLELAYDAIRSGEKIGEDKLELIEKPIASLNNSSKLIDKVMKLKRLKSRAPGHYPVDISIVLARVKERYSHMAGRDITINYVPPAECTVMADELADEVFLNLVDNSIKHSRKDMPVAIDIIQTTVHEDGGKYVRVSIEDNGPGISDDVKEKLFERFSRGETKARGKGLGLYLVKTLVEDFNGKIWAEDRVPGDHTKGAKFVVTLPVVEIN